MENMIITISPDGSVTIEVKGVKGKSCANVTKQIESALGTVTGDKKTAEYFEGVNNVAIGH